MSSTKEDLIRQLLGELTGALQLKLPLEHFSQFYNDLHFDNVAQMEAKKVLGNFQASSELSMHETFEVATELFPKLQDVIKEWKVRNEENKTQCDLFLQSQVDFLVCDFRTSVMIKLIAAPDAGLEDLETFMERRKMVLIDIFDKLSKPGEPRSSVNTKTRLDEKLESLKLETVEKQRLHLEQNATAKAKKVLEDTKGIILEKTRQLQSEFRAYQGKFPKDLVRGKLEEIICYLCAKGKELKEHHPQIYSTILRTTAEVRKCLEDKDYQDMTAEEIAETLHEQLLYDFGGESPKGEDARAIAMELVNSNSSSDDNACASSGNQGQLQNERGRNEEVSETQQCQQNEVLIDVAEEEDMKEENGDEVDHDRSGLRQSISGTDEALLIQSGDDDDGENPEEDDEEKEENSTKMSISPVHSSTSSNSKRSSTRLQKSRNLVAVKHSKLKRQCIVAETKQTEDERSESSVEDSTTDDNDEDDPDSSSEANEDEHESFYRKPSRRKVRRPVNGPLNDDKSKSSAEKITYLHLNGGRPVYNCNVCNRRCFQNVLQYHGEHCGKKEMPFNCDECGKGFLRKQYLQEHERIHTGERPYECPKCSDRFTQTGSLNRHMRAHNRSTRFACKVCKLRFISSKCLQGHNMSVHKEKFPFGCMYCNERFDLMYKLRTHVISHADVPPYRCPTCDTSSNSKPTLVKHLETGHSQPRHIAQKVADDAAVAFLVEETKDESYLDTPKNKIHSLVVSHIIKKANLKLPKGKGSTTYS